MYLYVKRFFDIILASLVLVCLLPLFIPIMIGLKLTGEGEVFYFQKRIGYKNKYFNIWKFATMLKNSPNIGTGSITLRKDPRVLPMGHFLRKTKINELPQIMNVLNGELSIVGPRPLVDQTFNAYPPAIQAIVYNSKPGITGIGSLVFRDEEGLFETSTEEDPHVFYKKVIAPYKGALEEWYQRNISFSTDFKIIFLTAWAIIFPKTDLVYKWFPTLPQRPF